MEAKEQAIEEIRRHEKDTGSPEVTIALLTHRIRQLTEHLKRHKKDHSTRRGLRLLVGQRRRLCRYLARHDYGKYLEVIDKLGLRKQA